LGGGEKSVGEGSNEPTAFRNFQKEEKFLEGRKKGGSEQKYERVKPTRQQERKSQRKKQYARKNNANSSDRRRLGGPEKEKGPKSKSRKAHFDIYKGEKPSGGGYAWKEYLDDVDLQLRAKETWKGEKKTVGLSGESASSRPNLTRLSWSSICQPACTNRRGRARQKTN